MKRPAFQFYPADWRKDVELQSCSMAAQGLWINAMCLAHECEPYGHLTINGKAMTPAQLGRQVGLSAKECEALLEELVEAGVARKTYEGVIYSSRMVRDERLRNVRADAGRLGGNPNLVKQKDNQEVNQKDNQTPNQSAKQSPTPSSSSSSSTSVSPSSLRSEGEAAKSPPPPPAPKKQREQITLTAYLALCKASGVKPVPDDHAIRRWCEDAGIGPEMLQVAWVLFRERYTEAEKAKGKRYKDWPAHFATAVKANWFKLWFVADDGKPAWTSVGVTHKAALEARMTNREAAHGHA